MGKLLSHRRVDRVNRTKSYTECGKK